MKLATDIIRYGRPKPYFDNRYQFNTIDVETVNNNLFLVGSFHSNKYEYTMANYYYFINDLFIDSVQHNHDILSWSRYDNTFIIKTLIEQFSDDEQLDILSRIGKVTPLFYYEYHNFRVEVTNVIKENIILTIYDSDNHKKRLTLYNLKNLFDSDLETTARDYRIEYYSKLGEEFHIIDPKRFIYDNEYKENVIKSNYLDNVVLIDIAKKLLANFEQIAGVMPKTIYTAGSLARSYLLTIKDINFNLRSLVGKKALYSDLLDYSMKSYHGGKIESYTLGYVPTARIIDITSAYPYALANLPKLTSKIHKLYDADLIRNYYYAFIRCKIHNIPDELIHPITIASPINLTNISPSGTFEATITKPEYDYLIENGIRVEVYDFVVIEHEDEYPYQNMIQELFNKRLENKTANPSLAGLYKLILNSLYGITYELTDTYRETDDDIIWQGYRAGDFFNPVIASYITALTRTYLSTVSQNILDNGGIVYLNMTDSIIYNGYVSLDVFSDVKTLGKFEPPTEIKNVIILGAGRYEYMNEFTNKYTIKSRGFSVKLKDKSFYSELDLRKSVKIKHRTMITYFRATTDKYSLDMLGHLVEDDYIINPLNLGGKRIINNLHVNLKKEYTTTRPVRL